VLSSGHHGEQLGLACPELDRMNFGLAVDWENVFGYFGQMSGAEDTVDQEIVDNIFIYHCK